MCCCLGMNTCLPFILDCRSLQRWYWSCCSCVCTLSKICPQVTNHLFKQLFLCVCCVSHRVYSIFSVRVYLQNVPRSVDGLRYGCRVRNRNWSQVLPVHTWSSSRRQSGEAVHHCFAVIPWKICGKYRWSSAQLYTCTLPLGFYCMLIYWCVKLWIHYEEHVIHCWKLCMLHFHSHVFQQIHVNLFLLDVPLPQPSFSIKTCQSLSRSRHWYPSGMFCHWPALLSVRRCH